MNHPWAVRIAGAGKAAAAELRLEIGIETYESGDALWLRGSACDERLDLLLRRLPEATRCEVLADGQLRPEGKRLPSGRLPDGPWMPIKSWAAVELPVAMLAARSADRIPFGLERASTSHEASLLLTTRADWAAFGTRAAQVRLDKLTFAACSDGRVLVRGTPLPPIAGRRLYEQAGVAVPCGWGWPAWLIPELVRTTLELTAQDVALFSTAGTWEVIPGDQFVRATRSAVRLSAQVEKE